jgi:chromosomal replication initiation ATPase DnaA
MSTDVRQLGLDLAPPPAMERADFLAAAPNALALALIEAPGGLPGGRLVLSGPEGAGKTHLASIWAQAGGGVVRGSWLSPATLPRDLPALLAPDAPLRLVLDEAEGVAGDPAREEALFHLLNHLAGVGGQILLTARAPVQGWGLGLPDLASRLTAAAQVAVQPPDDALLTALLVKLFADRQAQVGPDLILWLVARIERSFAAARSIVARLDAEALRLRRPITRAFAQAVLADTLAAGQTEVWPD